MTKKCILYIDAFYALCYLYNTDKQYITIY